MPSEAVDETGHPSVRRDDPEAKPLRAVLPLQTSGNSSLAAMLRENTLVAMWYRRGFEVENEDLTDDWLRLCQGCWRELQPACLRVKSYSRDMASRMTPTYFSSSEQAFLSPLTKIAR